MTPYPEEYLVLIGCQNDETGARFEPGDVVTEDDFPSAVIEAWLSIEPPVLAPIDDVAEEEE